MLCMVHCLLYFIHTSMCVRVYIKVCYVGDKIFMKFTFVIKQRNETQTRSAIQYSKVLFVEFHNWKIVLLEYNWYQIHDR